jgi:1-acyl-sn-glycerol-3-phosphate acyltransferase
MQKVWNYLVYGLWNVWFYFLSIVGILFLFPFLLLFSAHEKWYPQFFWLAHTFWAPFVMFGMGFFPSVRLSQPFEKGKSYVLVANHTSMIDIMLMFWVTKNPGVFVGKKELVKLPIFGYFYKRVCIMVDRQNMKSRKAVYERAKKRLSQGLGICIFPEGLVPDPSEELAPFKDGAFRMAIDFQIPIVPISFVDCKRRFPFQFSANYFKGNPGRLRAHVHPHISTQGMTLADKEALKNKTFAVILNELKKEGA